MPKNPNLQRWQQIAESYRKDHIISVDDVHYGPLIPGERDLQLLGDVENRWVLEVGCGTGENAVVLAKWGAHVVALDPAPAQLSYAQQLSQAHQVNLHLICGAAEELSSFRKDSFHLVLSAHSLDYVTEIEDSFRQVHRILKPSGRFVFSMIHPMMNCVGWYLMSDPDAPEIENYFEMNGAKHTSLDFQDGTQSELYHFRFTLDALFNLLVEQGFRVTALLEPRPYDLSLMKREDWSQIPMMYRDFDTKSVFYRLLQALPYTIIFQAIKEKPQRRSWRRKSS